MGNRCSGFLQAISASGRKMRMLNNHLDRYNTRIAELNDTLAQLNRQDDALVFRIRKGINELRQRVGKAKLSSHIVPGTPVYQMVAELADVKHRVASTQRYLGIYTRNRQSLNKLIQAEDQAMHIELSDDLKQCGLTLESVQQTGEEANIASAVLEDIAGAAEPVAAPDTLDVGALLAALLNEAPQQAATPIYASETNDVVHAVAELANGKAPIESDSHNNDDDDDASTSVVLNDQRPFRNTTVVELGE